MGRELRYFEVLLHAVVFLEAEEDVVVEVEDVEVALVFVGSVLAILINIPNKQIPSLIIHQHLFIINEKTRPLYMTLIRCLNITVPPLLRRG